MKKKYIAPSIEIINMEPTSIMEVSGWTPSGDKDKDGFGVTRRTKTIRSKTTNSKQGNILI